MKTGYLASGRTNQKWRTREALLKAANELMGRGTAPTVTEAADAARVARTTAYRYFPTQEVMLAQAALYASNASPGMGIDLAAAKPGTPAERVEAVVSSDWANTLLNEASFRVLLASAARHSGVERPANRVRWFDIALDEAKSLLSKDDLHRLICALSLCVGVESLVVLRDVCRVEADEAEQIKRWAARTLVESALAGKRRAKPRARGKAAN